MIELNKIYNEDAVYIINRIDSNIIDLTVTSPPYDQARDYEGNKFDFKTIKNIL